MKRYHLNKKEILYWAKQARVYLNLPKIRIDINKIDNRKDRTLFAYWPDKVISIGQIDINLILDYQNPVLNDYCKNEKEMIILAIFHEFAHYFQHCNYLKWFDKYRGYHYYNNFNGKHHEKKLERNANKIAVILFKKLYKVSS